MVHVVGFIFVLSQLFYIIIRFIYVIETGIDLTGFLGLLELE